MTKVITLAALSILSFIPLGLLMGDFRIALATALALVLPLVMYFVMSPKKRIVSILFAMSFVITVSVLQAGGHSPVSAALWGAGLHLLVVTLPFQFYKMSTKLRVDQDMLVYGSLTALLSTAAGCLVLYL